jgi:hypothetical protein
MNDWQINFIGFRGFVAMKTRAELTKALIFKPLYPNLSPAQSSDPKIIEAAKSRPGSAAVISAASKNPTTRSTFPAT